MPTTTAPTTTVRDLVTQVLAEGKLRDPHDIANEVYGRIPHQCVWLQETIYSYVRHVIHEGGWRGGTVPTPRTKTRASGKSRANGIGQTALATLRNVGKDPSGREIWKPFGECTAADLRSMARIRYSHAAANEAAGRRYDVLAAAMVTNKWGTVSKVPITELRRFGVL